MRLTRLLPALTIYLLVQAPAGFAQEPADPLEILTQTRALCAKVDTSTACLFARAQTAAIMANVVAEAGNTLDRGSFIGPIRALLDDPSPEIRTSALFALSKLGPEAVDTPAILRLARDPVSNVRGGAWAVAAKSPDLAARRVVLRVPERPTGTGYTPETAAFVPSAVGLSLPERLDFLWLAADLRHKGQLHFLSRALPEDIILDLAAGADGPARPPSAVIAEDMATADVLSPFLNPRVYGTPQVLTFPPIDGLPRRILVVFQDLAFGQTGLAVIVADARSLVPVPEADAARTEAGPDALLDVAAFDATILRESGFKPEADPEDTELFMAMVAAGGYGAEEYLQLYPDGAYSDQARAFLTEPRIVLGAPSFTDTEDIVVSFANLPDGALADVRIVPKAPDAEVAAEQRVHDANRESARFVPEPWLVPGVYWAIATVNSEDGSEFALIADFSLTQGQAELEVDKQEYAPGEQITVRFSGMSGDRYDYVSIATVGSSNNSFLAYAYTDGAREGSLTLPAPAVPGNYEMRAFFREDESTQRARLAFAVTGSAVPTTDATSVLPATNPGLPSPDARATLTADKASYAPGETITVTYGDMFGHPQDYISTAPGGSPNSSYLQYRYTEGAKAGTTVLTAPMEQGAYELRAFFMEDEAILRASLPFAVAGDAAAITPSAALDSSGQPSPAARARLMLDKTSYAPGEAITIVYAEMFGHPQDYVSIAPGGAGNGIYMQYAYTDAAKSGSVTLSAPTEPGAYEVRAFFMEDEAILRAMLPFVVK